MAEIALVWLRNDLRIGDNPALNAAMTTGREVVACHVEEAEPAIRRRGAASRWWLHHSLRSLANDLAAIGVPLHTSETSVLDIVSEVRPALLFANRRYGPAERAVDAALAGKLQSAGVDVQVTAGNVLVEPDAISTKTGGPYAVYTPFWNALRDRDIPVPLHKLASRGATVTAASVDTDYRTPDWARKLEQHWKIGEEAAKHRLHAFLDNIADYPEGRDFPAREATSKLSPHLAHGEISARQVWHAATAFAHRHPSKAGPVQKFLMELAWRDFNIHQLFHRPDIANVPMQRRFATLPWRESQSDLEAWQRGETGIAIVDAGMREMWETGFMHNRVRMLAASLLSKNLLLEWRLGERWFWDCLVDADSANNPGNWQWVAGCGNDAAPYFRIFNPDTQAEKFDPDGDYVRRWARTPRAPIVDLKTSRERALAAFSAI